MASSIAENVARDEDPVPVPNPTGFPRLYFDPHRGTLYRSTQSLDPRNHYELVDNPRDAAEIRAHGQYPLIVEPDIEVETLSPADLTQYLEYERVLQYEEYPPETHMIPFHLLSEARLHADAEDTMDRDELRGAPPYEGRREDLEPVSGRVGPGAMHDARGPGLTRVAGPVSAARRLPQAPAGGTGSIASAFQPPAYAEFLRAHGIDLGAGADEFLGRARGEKMWPMPGGRFTPDTMHDAAPTHRQLEPGFLGQQGAPPSIPKPGEVYTPREVEGNVERGRQWDLEQQAPPPGPAAGLIPLQQAWPAIFARRG